MAPEAETVAVPTAGTLQYVEHGDREGTPVLLLHGLSDSWHSFDRVLPHLPRSVRAFAVSMRGHGDSSRPDTRYRPRDLAEDAAAFLDALDVDSAVIVGHSLGSTIAQRFAIDHPDRTRGLVLGSAFHSLADSPVSEEVWGIVSAMEDPVDENFVREFQESTLGQPVPDAFFETIVQESRKVPARVWRETVAGVRENAFKDELEAIRVPTLLVWGEEDTMVPRSEQDAQVEALPDARLVVYPDTGHAVHWEEPERFASDLASFVKTVDG